MHRLFFQLSADNQINSASYRDPYSANNLDNLNDISEENPSFLDFENNWVRTNGRTDGRTDPLLEMRGRI